jgi:hypothetical protein
LPLFLVLCVPLCLLGTLGLIVNPFPFDDWFWTKDRLFVHWPGGPNYSPIAATAFLYAGLDVVSFVLGLGLEGEFRLAAGVLSALLLLSGVFILLTCRALGMPRMGIAVSLVTVAFAQSCYVTQSFWSEGVVLPLVSATMYRMVSVTRRPPRTAARTIRSALVMGTLVGLLTITRAVPVVFIPAVLFLAWMSLERRLAHVYGTVTLGVLILIVQAQMVANYLRFERYELTDSAGLHLWNAISPIADELVVESADYQFLKKHAPDLEGMTWQDLCSTINFRECPYDVIKRVGFQGVLGHPLRFLAHDFGTFRRFLTRAPEQFGLFKNKIEDAFGNPLRRTEYLPPLVPELRGFSKIADLVHAFGFRSYPTIVLLSVGAVLWSLLAALAKRLGLAASRVPRWRAAALIALGQLAFCASAWLTSQTSGITVTALYISTLAYPALFAIRAQSVSDRFDRVFAVLTSYSILMGALMYVFLASQLLTAYMETPDHTRFKIPYLALLAVMLCYAAWLVGSLVGLIDGSVLQPAVPSSEKKG